METNKIHELATLLWSFDQILRAQSHNILKLWDHYWSGLFDDIVWLGVIMPLTIFMWLFRDEIEKCEWLTNFGKAMWNTKDDDQN